MNTFTLYGLVLIGGKSERMKRDKAALDFHGKKQSVYAFELLENVCDKTFLSTRWGQPSEDLPAIVDDSRFAGSGPMGGMLSAMATFPNAAWLVLACDLPFVSTQTLKDLINNRDRQKLATAFKSARDGLPEPLCAIYEPQSQAALMKYFNNGKTCPRKFLITHDVKLLELTDTKALDNINTPEEYEKVVKNLK